MMNLMKSAELKLLTELRSKGVKPVKLQRRDFTMFTCWAPPGLAYSLEAFNYLVARTKKILLPREGEWGAVAEPCGENAKSQFHIHFSAYFGKNVKKTITSNMLTSLMAVYGQKNVTALDFTHIPKPDSLAGITKIVNDMVYVTAQCAKVQKKNNIKEGLAYSCSDGYNLCVGKLKAKQTCFEIEKKALNGVDPSNHKQFCYMKLKEGDSVTKLWMDAEASGNVAREMYIAANKGDLDQLSKNIKQLKATAELLSEPDGELNKMQNALENEIIKPAEGYRGRKSQLNFIVGPGNDGKSWYQDYMWKNYDAIEFNNAKSKDIAEAYGLEKLVNFNIQKGCPSDCINYSAVEALCDGKIFSPKYKSGMKRVPKPLVTMFMNEFPDITKMSADRYNIWVWDRFRKKFHNVDRLNIDNYRHMLEQSYGFDSTKELA